MANRYWVGGTAAWDGTAGTKWALTSNGTGGEAEPTAADDVFFDAASGANTVTISGSRVAQSITCTGFTGTLAGTATPALAISGNLTLATGMTVTYTGTTTFNATATITSNGKTLGPVTVNGSGITVTLADALNLGGNNLTITQGTFTTSASNYSVTAANLYSSNSNTRTITLNGSTVTLSGFLPVDFGTSTNLTFNAGTSTINCTTYAAVFNGGGRTFNNVSIGGSQNEAHSITGTNTFNNLTIVDRSGFTNGTNRLSLAANQTVTGTFTCNGTQTSPSKRYWIYSSVAGTNRTITAAAINIFGTDFRNITGAGAASWTDSSRTKYWGDAGGNSGITFATGRNVYWNLTGAQNWTATGWALTNNGTPAAANYPLIQDTAIFTEAGAAGTITLDSQGLMIGNLTMADGVSNRTSAMTLNFGAYDRDNFFGSITFFSNLTITLPSYFNRVIRLSGYNNTQSITSAGKTLPLGFEIAEGYNNTVTLQDPLTVQSDRVTILTNGTLNLNNNTLSTGSFSSNNSNTRVIQFGTGNITCTGSGEVWNADTATNMTYTGTPTVNISNNSSTAASINTHDQGGNIATVFNFNITTGTYTLTTAAFSEFGSLNFTGFAGTWSLQSQIQIGFYKNLTLVPEMTVSGNATLYWFHTSGTAILTSAGKTLPAITVQPSGGTLQLADNLTSNAAITLNVGTFNANNQNVTCTTFSSSNSNTRTLTMGSGTWTLSGTGTVWNTATTTGLTLNANTSTIVLSNTTTTARTFAGGGLTYNNLTIGGATGTSTLTIEGANTFNTLASTKTVAHTITFPNVTTTVSNWTITGKAFPFQNILSNSAYSTIANDVDGYRMNYLVAADSSISGTTPSYIADNTATATSNMILVFRPNTTPSSVTVNSLNNYADEGVLTTPSNQTITSGSGTAPLVALALYEQVGGGSITTRSFSPTQDGEVTSGTSRYIKYKIYNSAPANITVGMTSSSGTARGLASFYLQFNGLTSSVSFVASSTNGVVPAVQTGDIVVSFITTGNANSSTPITVPVSPTADDVTLTRTGASGTFTLAKSGGGRVSNLNYLNISNSTASTENTWYAGANSTDGGGNTNWLFAEAIQSLKKLSGSINSNKLGDIVLNTTSISDWLPSDGTVLSQAAYPELYSQIGLITDGFETWTARTSGTTSTVWALTYGNGIYVYGGNGGVIATSTNAITWTSRTSGTTSTIESIIYGNSTYVYAGIGGVIATSTDAITWNIIGSRTTSTIDGAIYDNGLYVYGGRNGAFATSADGAVWTTRTSGLSAIDIFAFAYGNGTYVTGGQGGGLATSTNGTTWTARSSGTTSIIAMLTYGNGTYVYSTTGGGLSTSTDAITWTTRTPGAGTNTIESLTYGNGLYVYGGQGGALATSTDAITWTARTSGTTSTINHMIYGNGLYVYAGFGGVLRTSTDAITWTSRTSGTTSQIIALTYGNGLYVYAGVNGVLATSTDAITWTARTSGTTSQINALTYGNGLYNYYGNGGVIATSTDAITWSAIGSRTTSAINDLTYGNGLYVYAGDVGILGTSTNAIIWTTRTSGTTSNINTLTYGNGLYVYSGNFGALATSTDAITWTSRTSGTASNINTLLYNNLYIYGADNGGLATSTDAITWTARTSGTASSIEELTYGNDLYVYAGAGGALATSTNAITWISRTSGTTSRIYALTYNNGTYVYGGDGGVLATAVAYTYNIATDFVLPEGSQSLTKDVTTINYFKPR